MLNKIFQLLPLQGRHSSGHGEKGNRKGGGGGGGGGAVWDWVDLPWLELLGGVGRPFRFGGSGSPKKEGGGKGGEGAETPGAKGGDQEAIMRYYRLWIYTCNVVLLAGAVGLAVAAGRVLTDARRSLLPGLANLSLTDPRLLAAALALAAQGGLLQALGCAGALRLSERLLHAYWFLLLALLLADAALGLAWLVRVHRLAADLRPALRARLATEYGASPAFTEAWDTLQRERHCCGVEGPHDFLLLRLPSHPYMQSASQGQSTTDGTSQSANPHALHNPFIQQPAVNFNGITSALDGPTKGDVDRGRRPDPAQYLTLPESCCRWVVPKARDRNYQQAAGAGAVGPLPPPPPPQQNKQTTATDGGQGTGSSVVRLPIVPQPIPIPPQSQNSSPTLPPCRNGNETIQRWKDAGDEEDATDNSLGPLAGAKSQMVPGGPTNPVNTHPNQVPATPAAGAALTSRNQRTQQSSKGHVIPPPPPEMSPPEGIAVGVGPCHRIGALAGFEGQAPPGSAWVPLSVFMPSSSLTAHSPSQPPTQSPHYGVLTGEAFATGCEARLLTWLRQSADGLFVLGFCVIAFLKLCFVGILRYEIREMVQKIRLLRGCGDEEEGGGIISPGERISVNGDEDDEDGTEGDGGVGANLIGSGVAGLGGGGDPSTVASNRSNSVTTTFVEGLAPPPPSAHQPLGPQQQPPPPTITHNHLVHNHLLLGGPSLLQPPQSPQASVPLLQHQHHNHVPLPRHLLLHHHHHLHHLLLAGGGSSGGNGGDSTALPMDAGSDSLESTPVHRRSSTVRTNLKDSLQNNNDGTDSDTNSNCALIVDRGSELSNASPPFNLRSCSGPNGNNNELHELQELRKKSVSRQTQI
ncbi:uncharacterized protein [Hetaerina americana]|uniref:uncharacterized protein n=1 Tax=Hetaerina americana TaxID=62018 RepID=UPI003A7F4046